MVLDGLWRICINYLDKYCIGKMQQHPQTIETYCISYQIWLVSVWPSGCELPSFLPWNHSRMNPDRHHPPRHLRKESRGHYCKHPECCWEHRNCEWFSWCTPCYRLVRLWYYPQTDRMILPGNPVLGHLPCLPGSTTWIETCVCVLCCTDIIPANCHRFHTGGQNFSNFNSSKRSRSWLEEGIIKNHIPPVTLALTQKNLICISHLCTISCSFPN